MQRFKSVYFADHPGGNAKRRNLKLAFGPRDVDLFRMISPLASEDIRHLLGCGTFGHLKTQAEADGRSVNAYSLRRLREALARPDSPQVDFFLPERAEEYPSIAIQATYRGGIAQPLHDWYPYLEGYSPDFVKRVLGAFAPAARRVLDPFAGTGTTPLTAASAGRMCFYCELNPVLQFLIEAKTKVLAMSEQDRGRLATRIRNLAGHLESSVIRHEPDRRLIVAYGETFRDSEFFPAATLETCLKLRSWLDTIGCDDPEAASVATVAAVAALVPCSNMIRRGDLRFRKGAERANIVGNLAGEVRDRLLLIAQDLANLQSIDTAPALIAGDAKRLNQIPGLDVDAIVTSPPYLNGTNYYRNTKIELWFLRALSSARDLTAFRRQTVTAGINDVTAAKTKRPVSAAVERIVRTLETGAYDRRIPLMVSSYFSDMRRVFKGLLHHAKPSSPFLLDIGDSSYAGVRVDTPAILADLLRADGWKVKREVMLRQRLSRSGHPLRQVLLVATAPPHKRTPRVKATRNPKWDAFKRNLPHQQGDFAKRNWGSSLHSLCSYQGKLKPSLAHHLVKTFTSPGDRLLDPFGGVGTIALEAALHGVTTWSFDISPVAVPVATAKLNPARSGECMALLDQLNHFIQTRRPTNAEHEEAKSIRFNGQLSNYYHPRTLDEILLARRFFRESPPTSHGATLVFACLLHILHGNRPYALSRRSHPITPFSPRGKAEYKELVVKLEEKVHRALAAKRSEAFTSGTSIFQDATGRWPQDVDQLDAVITSPPFYDSTRFHLANWIRLWFAGWTTADFKERPLAFVEERQKRNFDVYEPILRQARERLKRHGICVFHLGKSRKCDMAREVAEVARPWFRDVEMFSEDVAHCESHGIRDKGTVVEHMYLLMS